MIKRIKHYLNKKLNNTTKSSNYSVILDYLLDTENRIEFLIERDNKLQQIEQMFKSGQVDLEELADIVKDG